MRGRCHSSSGTIVRERIGRRTFESSCHSATNCRPVRGEHSLAGRFRHRCCREAHTYARNAMPCSQSRPRLRIAPTSGGTRVCLFFQGPRFSGPLSSEGIASSYLGFGTRGDAWLARLTERPVLRHHIVGSEQHDLRGPVPSGRLAQCLGPGHRYLASSPSRLS